MSYRNSRANNPQNNSNRRYGTRSSNDYSPAYSTQGGYQQQQQTNNTSNNQFNQNFKQQPQAATAAKTEYEAPQPMSQAVKTDPTTPPPPAATTEVTEMVQDSDTKSEKSFKKRTFIKLPKKIKKKRLNAKLRNLLAPKNAMMVLHELQPGLSCVTNEEPTNTGQASYTVVINIDGKQYKGQGLSKAQAKQTACENALKAALFEKMAQSNMKPGQVNISCMVKAESTEMDTTETTESSANGSDTAGAEVKTRKPPEEDDVPWGSLASYALFKLFSEWQAQGYTIPTNPGKAQLPLLTAEQAAHTMMPMKKMPADAAQRHPVQLLNQLKPHAQYFETREGNPPNIVFTFTVTYDGQTFTGDGPNKKDAKKACAKNALISLGIQYSD